MEDPFASLDEKTKIQIQELQILEQNFQQLLMQKQAFSMELNETDYALKELDKSDEEVFKIVANQIIVKSSKDKLKKELAHKKELLDLRLKNIEKQEKEFSDKINTIRDEVMKKISNK